MTSIFVVVFAALTAVACGPPQLSSTAQLLNELEAQQRRFAAERAALRAEYESYGQFGSLADRALAGDTSGTTGVEPMSSLEAIRLENELSRLKTQAVIQRSNARTLDMLNRAKLRSLHNQNAWRLQPRVYHRAYRHRY